MQFLGLFGAAIGFLAVGLAMVLYEISRAKAGRPISTNSQGAVQVYYMAYLTMFVLALTFGLKAILG